MVSTSCCDQGEAQSLSEFQTARCLLFFVCFLFCLLLFIVFCFVFCFFVFSWGVVFFLVCFLLFFDSLFFIILLIFNFPMNEGLSTS